MKGREASSSDTVAVLPGGHGEDLPKAVHSSWELDVEVSPVQVCGVVKQAEKSGFKGLHAQGMKQPRGAAES